MSRHEEIVSQIESEIRRRPVGSRLPSFRSLMASFKTSQATVTRALEEFEREGLIIRRRGSGIYVGAAAKHLHTPRTGTIAFLVPDVSNRAVSLIVRGGEEVCRARRLRTQVWCYGEVLPGPGLELAEDVAGVIILPRSVDVDTGAALLLLESLPGRLQKVLVENDAPGRRCPFVGLDDFNAGVRAGQEFRRRGIERLACLGSSISHVAQTRLSGLATGFGSFPETVIDFPAPEHFDREALRRISASGIQGLFISRPDIALQTLCFLESLRVRVPDDLFVATIAEEEDERSYPFRVAAIVKPTLEVGREAVRALPADASFSRRLPYRVSSP